MVSSDHLMVVMFAQIQAVKECMNILVDKLYNGGKIKDKCENAGFYERLTLIEQQFKGAAVLLHKMGHFPPEFRKIWSNERLLNVVEQLIGPDIAGRQRCNSMCSHACVV